MAHTLTYLAAGAALVLAWHLFFARYNRDRAIEVLHWIEGALAGYGHVTGIRWFGASRFLVPIRLNTHVFQHASVVVQITRREMPYHWLVDWARKRPETLTFEADLDHPPAFNLAVHNHRWWGKTAKQVSLDPDRWVFEQTAPLLLTSSPKWKRDSKTMLHTLFSCREKEFLRLLFRRSSPHFVATLPLTAVVPSAEGENFFHTLMEVASGSSTSRL